MKTIYGLPDSVHLRRPVVALGVFDGLHRGHQLVIKAAVKKARAINGTSVVLTFWPHPQKKESLYSLEHRLELIRSMGVEVCIVVKFTAGFSRMGPSDFIKKVLFKKIGAEFIYVGRNFRFGANGSGDCSLLAKEAKRLGFKIKIFNILKSAGSAVSSTQIRKLIKSVRIRRAGFLLGRPVSVWGRVGRGSRVGRIIGFPTANIVPLHEVIPAPGIYCVRVVLNSKKYHGICYIGTRPTITPGEKKNRVEVHIFNFNKNIYGKKLQVQFIKFIRADRKFPDLAALTAQIRKDTVICKKNR